MSGIFLSLGSNIGDRKKNLTTAVNKLKENNNKIEKISSIYETEPVGYKEQNRFFNIVIEIDTGLPPYELLKLILNVEKDMGRERKIHWGPRNIDIDIIFYKNLIINEPNLIIPHKEMHKRNFVLVPMNEIFPDFIHPVFKKSINDILKNSDDKCDVVIVIDKL